MNQRGRTNEKHLFTKTGPRRERRAPWCSDRGCSCPPPAPRSPARNASGLAVGAVKRPHPDSVVTGHDAPWNRTPRPAPWSRGVSRAWADWTTAAGVLLGTQKAAHVHREGLCKERAPVVRLWRTVRPRTNESESQGRLLRCPQHAALLGQRSKTERLKALQAASQLVAD